MDNGHRAGACASSCSRTPFCFKACRRTIVSLAERRGHVRLHAWNQGYAGVAPWLAVAVEVLAGCQGARASRRERGTDGLGGWMDGWIDGTVVAPQAGSIKEHEGIQRRGWMRFCLGAQCQAGSNETRLCGKPLDIKWAGRLINLTMANKRVQHKRRHDSALKPVETPLAGFVAVSTHTLSRILGLEAVLKKKTSANRSLSAVKMQRITTQQSGNVSIILTAVIWSVHSFFFVVS